MATYGDWTKLVTQLWKFVISDCSTIRRMLTVQKDQPEAERGMWSGSNSNNNKKWRENSAVGSSGSPYSTRLQVGHTLCGYRWVILYAITGGFYSTWLMVGHTLRGYRWVILYAVTDGSYSTQLKASCIFCTIITDILMICYQIIMSSWCNKNSN